MHRTRLIIGALSACGVLWAAGTALADGYAAAGCGLGSLLIKKDGFVQIFAATTNGTSGNQTFAISSGTSNCDAGAKTAGVSAYTQANRETLAREAARGEGETVAALSELAECEDSVQVGAALQSQYSAIFPNAGVSDAAVGDAVVKTLKDDKSLGCKIFVEGEDSQA